MNGIDNSSSIIDGNRMCGIIDYDSRQIKFINNWSRINRIEKDHWMKIKNNMASESISV